MSTAAAAAVSGAMPSLEESGPSPSAAAVSPAVAPPPRLWQRFHVEFATRLHAQQPQPLSSVPSTASKHSRPLPEDREDDEGEEEEAELRRLSSQQATALTRTLWEWMLVLHASTAPDVHINANTEQAVVRPPPLRPQQVASIFQSGIFSLIPSIQSLGSGRGIPVSPADVPPPWEHAHADRQRCPPKDELVRLLPVALTQLSPNGPLFSSWCSLVYVCCTNAPPLSKELKAVPGHHGDDNKDCRLLQLQQQWMAATAACADTLAEDAVVRLWRQLRGPCPPAAIGDEPSTASAGTPADVFALWVAQWYYECCRVAARGRDTAFATDAVPTSCLTRVHLYLCARLAEEVSRLRATASVEESTSATEEEKDGERSSGAAARPWRVATLSGLALQSPETLVGAGSGSGDGERQRRNTHSRQVTQRRRRHQRRKRRRGRTSYDGDEEDSFSSETEEDAEEEEKNGRDVGWVGAGADGVTNATACRAGERTPLQRFLATCEQARRAPVASSVLTVFTLTPHSSQSMELTSVTSDAAVGQRTAAAAGERREEKVSYTASVTQEMFLRAGEVQWWTVGDSQRHRQLLSEKRS